MGIGALLSRFRPEWAAAGSIEKHRIVAINVPFQQSQRVVNSTITALELERARSVKPFMPNGQYQTFPHDREDLPPPLRWWFAIWLILAGRGSGKTRTGAEYCLWHLRTFGPKLGAQCRVGAGSPDFPSARDVQAEGESGLITIARGEFPVYNRSLGEAIHIDGGTVKFMGSEKPSRWNGPQWSLLWADELALWEEESWKQARFGLRLGPHPAAVVTTTPKNREFVKQLLTRRGVIVSTASTYDNPHLSDFAREELRAEYEGTTLGLQELHAQFVTENPSALWRRSIIDGTRITPRDLRLGQTLEPEQDHRDGDIDLEESTTDPGADIFEFDPRRRAGHVDPETGLWLPGLPELVRVVVGVDPPSTSPGTVSTRRSGGGAAEAGIVVAARGSDSHCYLLADWSTTATPDEWGRLAVEAYNFFQADLIVGEVNNGGDMVENTIRTARTADGGTEIGRDVNFKQVRASRGKAIRAEPVAALSRQGVVHHVGPPVIYIRLESQLCTWVPGEKSPDRLDAYVWALTELMLPPDEDDPPPGVLLSGRVTGGRGSRAAARGRGRGVR